MQLSFADAQKLLISAKEYNCVILLDSVPVDVVCHDNYIYCELKTIDDDSEVFYKSRGRVDVDDNSIIIGNRKIQIYKQPMTKEEYLNTLEFLKND